MDSQYSNFSFHLSELKHEYGSQVHILSNPTLLSLLAKLCSDQTFQPWINELVTQIYQQMIVEVINREFPRVQQNIQTRMAADHPKEGHWQGPVVDPSCKVVSVNLARAGTLPSHICYSFLNYLMDPQKVRQDHISIARQTNAQHEVTESAVSGHKIGGPVDDCIVLIPDPMGATGGTLVKTLQMYKSLGKARKYIAIHCIVTPEYLKRVCHEQPDLIVYTARLDRGLSQSSILQGPLGAQWNREKGLNQQSYIVPGGGGFGEILNNAFV